MWNAIRMGVLACVLATAGGVRAADNQLTAKEKAAGWQIMFDGKSFAGWEDPTKANSGTDGTFPGAFSDPSRETPSTAVGKLSG
jgi:hypothetical protein